MTGAAITVTEVYPAMNMKLIFFSGTTDASKLLDFSEYATIKLINAWDATNPGATGETVASITDGGDVTFTNALNAIVGRAFVTE